MPRPAVECEDRPFVRACVWHIVRPFVRTVFRFVHTSMWLSVLTTTLPPTSVGAKLRNTQRFLLLPFKYTSPFNLRRKIRASQAKRAAVRALNARQGTPYGIQIGELTKETPYVSVGDDEYNAADDPLGHLAADERQAKMASMSLGELRKLEQERIRNEKARTKRGRG